MRDPTAISQTATDSQQKKGNAILGRWQKMDWFSRLGWLIAICLGAVEFTGFFFPWVTSPKPNLSYRINPIRTPIIQAADLSDLAVTYKGQPVTTNVTAAQVAIWNAGRVAIKSENILDPIYVYTTNAQILEAKLVSVNRGVTQVSAVQTGQSQVNVNWKILEKDDRALLQIVYTGSGAVPILLKGTIEGQSAIYHSIPKRDTVGAFVAKLLLTLVLGALFIGVLVLWAYIATSTIVALKARWSKKALINVATAILIVFSFVLIYIWLRIFNVIVNVAAGIIEGKTPYGF